MKRYLSLKPLVPWMTLKHPIAWDRVFSRPAPLEVEIGFGLGDYLVRKAQESPDRNFLGIDMGWVSVRRALRKIALAHIHNVRLIQTDARIAFERLFSENAVHAIYALFPCPWPKKKHIKHRLFSNRFLKLLNSRLVKDGKVLIVTDHQAFFEWMLSQISGTGFRSHNQNTPSRYDTKYEKKWLNLGQKRFYELNLIKDRHIPIPEKEDVTLLTHIVGQFDPEQFTPPTIRGEITVEFKETLYDPKRSKGMVRCVVMEDPFLQHVWIEIVKKEDGWHIRPAKGIGMVPTAGIQRALDAVREGIKEVP